MEAELIQLLPHRPPILMLEAVLRVEADRAAAAKTFREGDYGSQEGRVLESALIEALAQTAALIQGGAARTQGRGPARGLLVGVEDFLVLAPVQVDRPLELAAAITRRLGPFFLVEGAVRQEGVVVARGLLKIYVEEETGEAPERT